VILIKMLLTWKHVFVFIWVGQHSMITKLSLGAKIWYSKNIHFNCRSVYTHFCYQSKTKTKVCKGNRSLGTNEIKWANDVIFKKDYMSFWPIFNFFHMNEFLNCFSQIIMKNVYNFLIKWLFFKKWINMKFWKCIDCKLYVAYFKVITISDHNQKWIF
jgi:hypothetical protein